MRPSSTAHEGPVLGLSSVFRFFDQFLFNAGCFEIQFREKQAQSLYTGRGKR